VNELPGAQPARPGVGPPLTVRASGVLAHLSSLPGPHGIGDLGDVARDFVDILAEAEQRIWQMLPVCALGNDSSPYSSVSAFAGEPRYISLLDLCEDGLLQSAELPPPSTPSHTDYARAFRVRAACLDAAERRFRGAEAGRFGPAYEAFRAHSLYWLDDFACFESLRRAGEAVHTSRQGFAAALARVRSTPSLAALAERVRFEQFLFARQWQRLHDYARARDVALMGDIPIFVAHHSADVLAHAELFKLAPDGTPSVVSGVPPDYFSEYGQRWGTPVYDVAALADEGYRYFIERFRSTFARFDIARIDHFVGFVNAWEIPAEHPTAVHGRWVEGPGRALFDAAEAALGALALVAEDLGSVSAEVVALRDALGHPGMRVLQFGFDSDLDDPFLPHNYPSNAVAYTGTHDNDTWLGFVREPAGRPHAPSEQARLRAARYLGIARTDPDAVWVAAAAEALCRSHARTVILPLQDLLLQGNDARMNLPGTLEGNFLYRAPARGVAEGIGALASALRRTGRARSHAWQPTDV
jgi:4-alpha-glucanotransferase